MVDSYPILTLLPPIVAIVLVIATRKVLISLFTGSLLAALLIANFNPLHTVQVLWEHSFALLWDEGALNSYNLLILLFLLTLGVITSLVLMAGGTGAFSEWARSRVRTRRQSQILTGFLGMAIFIDDYFNALAVGQISRPISDSHKVSRAKLAYLLDSSSAPVVVLAPFSSWGASIIGIMTPLVAASALQMSEVEVFVRAAATNYYAIAAILLLWLVIFWQLDFGPMRKEEERAVAGAGLHAPDDTAPGQLTDDLPKHEPGALRALIVPFLALVVGVIGGMYLTGGMAAGAWGVMDTMANADVAVSLNIGGFAGFFCALYYCLRYTRNNPAFNAAVISKGAIEGGKSMLPAIYILILAWLLGSLIGALGTGSYLAELVARSQLAPIWMVPVLFIVAGFMAFATGTSWGSFGILLPLAGEIMNSTNANPELLIAAFGAVLAGAVWGDHSSPISDTTILSSTGAACSVSTHINTQLPYALCGAAVALFGYVVFAFSGQWWLGLLSTCVLLVVLALGLKTTAARRVSA